MTRVIYSRTSLDEFMATKAALDAKIKALTALSDDHFDVLPDDVTWADVGMLNRANVLLAELCDFLNV